MRAYPKWLNLSLVSIALAAACSPGAGRTGRVELRFPPADSARTTDAYLAASLSCAPDLVIHAQEEQGLEQSQDHALTSGVSFLFENYFTFPSTKALLVGDEFDPSLSLELPVETSWSFSARGAVLIRAGSGSTSTSSVNALALAESVSASGSLFRSSVGFGAGTWTCGDASAWDATTVTIEPATAHLDISQVVIPLYAKDSDPITPTASQSTSVALNVTAAKLPFGIYSTTHLQDFGLVATGASPSPLVSVMDPFVNIQLKNITSLVAAPSGHASDYGTLKVIPLLKNLQTSEVWRGVGGMMSTYETGFGSGVYMLHLNPLPGPGLYRIGVLLECPSSSPDCATFGDPSKILSQFHRLCLTADVDLQAGESNGLSRAQASSDLAWDLDLDPTASTRWTIHYNSTNPTALATSCTSLFFD